MTLKKLFAIFVWWNLIIIELPMSAVKLNALHFERKERKRKNKQTLGTQFMQVKNNRDYFLLQVYLKFLKWLPLLIYFKKSSGVRDFSNFISQLFSLRSSVQEGHQVVSGLFIIDSLESHFTVLSSP